MNKAIRWRIITLQSILVLVLAGAAGFLVFEGNFVTSMVRDQLVAQSISFPGQDQVKAGGALDPANFPTEITQYAGQPLDNGDKAKAYANDFIGKHLQGVANGLTYAGVGGKVSQLNAQLATTSKDDPNYAALQTQITTLNAQRDTLFKGETLRSILLNAYGWWTIGVYTTFAGFGLMVAALAALAALAFELFIAGRKPQTVQVVQKIAA